MKTIKDESMVVVKHNRKGVAVQSTKKDREGRVIYREYLSYKEHENKIMLSKLRMLKDMLDRKKAKA